MVDHPLPPHPTFGAKWTKLTEKDLKIKIQVLCETLL